MSTTPATAWLTPERLAHAEFRHSFRGFDATEVRSFLARAASELRAVLDRTAALESDLESAEERRSVAAPAAPLDMRQVSELLGQETARVLETAREAAADIRAKAVTDATAALDAAEAEASRLRAQAEELLLVQRAEMESEAAAVVAKALADAQRVTEDAQVQAQEIAAQGEAACDAAREDGRRMVAEARAVRERILTDMARRRNVARQQLERVRAARERLIDAIEVVAVSVGEVKGELTGTLVEAKLAGERAARAVDVEQLPTMRELESEVDMAKDTGLIDMEAFDDDDGLSPLDTGEFAVVTAPEPEVEVTQEERDAMHHQAGAELGTGSSGSDEQIAAAAAARAEAASAARPAAGRRRSGRVEVTTFGRPTALEPTGSEASDPDPEPDPESVTDTDAPAPLTEAPLTDDVVAEDLPPQDPQPSSPQMAGDEATVVDLTDVEEVPPTASLSASSVPPTTRRGRGRRTSPSARRADELFARLRSGEDEAGGTNGYGGANESKRSPTNGVGALAVVQGSVEGAGEQEEVGGTRPAAAEAGAESGEPDSTVVSGERVRLLKRDAQLAGTVRDLSRQLKLALSDQQNELLEATRGAKAKGGPPRAASVEELAAPFLAAAKAELVTAAAVGWRSVAETATGAPSELHSGDAAQALAQAIGETLRGRLHRESDDTGHDGDAEPVPAERIRGAYREVRSQRLAELVEHHVLMAYASGQLAGAPAGSPARWVCDSCGPDCLDNALAGPVVFGEAFPTGHVAPPAFSGCRCMLVRESAEDWATEDSDS